MSSRISKRRKEMGEQKWMEYQKKRLTMKSKRNYLNHMYMYSHWRGNIKKILVEYKGGKCEICGYNKPFMTVYCFHHKEPNLKDFGISRYMQSVDKMKHEVDKCMLLCHNCHNELHEKIMLAKKQKYYDAREKIDLDRRRRFCDK